MTLDGDLWKGTKEKHCHLLIAYKLLSSVVEILNTLPTWTCSVALEVGIVIFMLYMKKASLKI